MEDQVNRAQANGAQATALGTAIKEVFPYLCVRDAGAAIDFYKRAFGAEEVFRLTEPTGRIGHAEMKLGPLTIMIADEYPEFGFKSPLAYGGSSVTLHLHVESADEMAKQALDAGATMVCELKDEFYGERGCRVRDPFGHEWLLGHSIEEVSPEEMQRRYDELFKQ